MIERGELVPTRKFLRIARKIVRRETRITASATQQLVLPRSLQLAHDAACEWMELISVASRRRDLHLLLVESEQRAMEIRAGTMVDPHRGTAVGGLVGGVGCSREV